MFENTDFGKVLTVMRKTLDTAVLRHGVISNNLANVDTPGFKESRVSFEVAMRRALSKEQPRPEPQAYKTNPKHFDFYEQPYKPSISEVKPYIIPIMKTRYRNDVNNVDIDEEMANLAKNQLVYEAMIQRVSGEFNLLKEVIKQGGGR